MINKNIAIVALLLVTMGTTYGMENAEISEAIDQQSHQTNETKWMYETPQIDYKKLYYDTVQRNEALSHNILKVRQEHAKSQLGLYGMHLLSHESGTDFGTWEDLYVKIGGMEQNQDQLKEDKAILIKAIEELAKHDLDVTFKHNRLFFAYDKVEKENKKLRQEQSKVKEKKEKLKTENLELKKENLGLKLNTPPNFTNNPIAIQNDENQKRRIKKITKAYNNLVTINNCLQEQLDVYKEKERLQKERNQEFNRPYLPKKPYHPSTE